MVSFPDESPFVGLIAPWATARLACESAVVKTFGCEPVLGAIWMVKVPDDGRLFVARSAAGGLTQSYGCGVMNPSRSGRRTRMSRPPAITTVAT